MLWICKVGEMKTPATAHAQAADSVTLVRPGEATQFTRLALIPMKFLHPRGHAPICAGGEYHRFGEISLTHMWSRGQYEARAADLPLRRDQYLITLCLSGGCELQQRGRLALRANQVMIMPCDGIHGFSTAGDLETLSLRTSAASLLRAIGGGALAPLLCTPVETAQGLPRVLADTMSSFWQSRNSLMAGDAMNILMPIGSFLRAIFEEKFKYTASAAAASQSLYWRIREDILSHMGQPDICSAVCAARRLGRSPGAVHAALRAMGTSFGTLAMDMRLSQAALLLRSPLSAHQTITALALSVGFADLSHFSRRFHQRFGQSPRAYRGAARMD